MQNDLSKDTKLPDKSGSFDLSIVIVNYNTRDLTLACVNSIKQFTKDINYEIIIVDNASSRNFPKSKDYKLITNKTNLGFTGGNNIGMKKANGRYVLLLNSDTLIHNNVLGEMIPWMDKNPKIGIASCSLKNRDGSLQGTGGYFPTLIRIFSLMTIQDLPFVDQFIKPFHPTKEKSFTKNDKFYLTQKELDWVTGAFMLMRRKVIKEVGYLDEKYFMYTEETDYCFRAKEKGWIVFYNPKWSITHLGGASKKGHEFSVLSEYRNLKLFYKKHYPSWQYPVLRLLLKIGALGRMLVLGTIRGKEYIRIYAKAFREA